MTESEIRDDIGYWILINEPSLAQILCAKTCVDPIKDISFGLMMVDSFLEHKPMSKIKRMFPRYFQEVEQENKQLACADA